MLLTAYSSCVHNCGHNIESIHKHNKDASILAQTMLMHQV